MKQFLIIEIVSKQLSTLICIPVFNEEGVIGKIVEECKKYGDVVVCDDGSEDKTSTEAKSKGVICLKHEKNLGKGAALKTLFDYAKKLEYNIIVTIDGDGQFLPKEIPKLIKSIENKEADIVIGYRFDDAIQMPSYRKFGNKMLDKIANLATDLPVRDSQSGFRAYSSQVIKEISFGTKGFGADAEILIDAAKKGFKIEEEKVSVIYETGRETSTKNPVSHSGEVVMSLLEIIAIKSPLKFVGIPGIILTALGIIFAAIVAIIFNETRYFSIPYTMIGIAFLLIGTTLTVMSVLLYSISRAVHRN